MSRDSLDDVRADGYASAESVGSIQAVLGSLVAIVLYLALAWAVITLPAVNTTPVRFVVVVPLLLFFPGYAFLSTLFPGRQPRETESVSPLSRSARFGSVRSIEQRGITWGERAALSFGLSLVWLPILALILAASPWDLTVEPIFAIVSGFVLLFATVGGVRRARLPPSERFVIPYQRWLVDARAAFSRSPADTLLTAVLALSMLAALASIGYALAVPTDATSSSEFYVGTINQSNNTDTLVYDGYPDRFVQGQPAQLTVGIENQEGRTAQYTVVAQFQRVGITNGETRVLERSEAARFRTTIPADNTEDTWNRTHRVSSPFTSNGQDVRLVYLLYVGDAPPANPTIANSEYHLWVWPGPEPTRPDANAGGPNASGPSNATGPNAGGGPNASAGPSGGPNGSSGTNGTNDTGA